MPSSHDTADAPRPSAENLARLGRQEHGDCFVCEACGETSLGVGYELRHDGKVAATTDCPSHWRSYAGRVHGGVVAALIDGAMTHCLFAHGERGVTADLHVRYRHPLRIGRRAEVTAELTGWSPPLFLLHAEVRQDDRLVARADAKFMRLDDAAA